MGRLGGRVAVVDTFGGLDILVNNALASDESSFITGSEIMADGGYTSR